MYREYDKFAITGFLSATGFELGTDQILFMIDDPQDATISGDADIIWATGRLGRNLYNIKRNKTATIAMNSGFVIGGLLAEQFGDRAPEVSTGDARTILYPHFDDSMEADTNGDEALTQYTATGVIGNEIGWIYKVNRDGSSGARFAQAATASATEFSYDPATRTIILPIGQFAPGERVRAWYSTLSDGVRFSNMSDSFARDIRLVCEIMVQDPCDGTESVAKLVYPRVSVSDTFSLSIGSDPVVQAFEGQAMVSMCEGESLLCYIIFPSGERV